MDLRSVVRPIVPPILYDVARQVRAGTWARPVKTAISFSPRVSFAEAAIEAGAGYGDENLLSRFSGASPCLTEMQDFVAPMLASLALAAQISNPLRVLDFGGGSGYFRSYVDGFFGGAIKTNWRVVETPEQVRYNEGNTSDEVSFSTSIGAEPYELALFSGSLQYLEDWRAPIRETNSTFIFISRTPLDETERPFLQTTVRGGAAFYLPGRVIAQQDLFAQLSETHDLFASWHFQAHLFEMGTCPSPAMLWRRAPA